MELIAVRPGGRLLRGSYAERVVGVMLTGLPEPHASVVGQRRRLGHARARQRVEVCEVGAADARRHRRKAHTHHLGAESERLEHQTAAVARRAGDAHLGHHLEQTCLESFPVSGFALRPGGGHREVGVHRAGADRHQAGHVVHVDDVTGDGDDVDRHASPGREQVLVHRAHSQGHRNRHARGVEVGAPVADGDDAAGLLRLLLQPLQLGAQRTVGRARRVEEGRLFEDSHELARAQHWRLELEQPRVFGHRRVVPAAQLGLNATLGLERPRARAE